MHARSTFRNPLRRCPWLLLSFIVPLAIGSWSHRVDGQEPFIPRKQTRPPGPPLSPQEAIEKMVVPPGFHVELVASEPQLQNPVAMAFDDRGRIYVTESFEYPRHQAGPGRDRIKILEDTDGDGATDKVTLFAEGLNIPSGIAVGYGGVWVANAPDILFLEDTDGDDRADKQTVVVTGFGRDDTHELPNALTWGPDGFLYGLNGVFNRSRIEQQGKRWEFTCAMFRIDPITHQFELFCEGTSNPWGIAFNQFGDSFVSACVIDHLWHLTETGYYHRQAGAYPPHTWKIESIVDYQHQMAAYCGIEFFDSPAYPMEYRRRFYLGNIHGGCINVDTVTAHGATYRGAAAPDFLTANDVWFMPVAQKIGPDGSLYILDWYDRYHCYQDAMADPQGIDRGHGRLYRIVYQTRPPVPHGDLRSLEDNALVDLLSDPNLFFRQRSAVVLGERLRRPPHGLAAKPLTRLLQEEFAKHPEVAGSDDSAFPLHLLGTLLLSPELPPADLAGLLNSNHPLVVAWTIRALHASRQANGLDAGQWQALARHPDPRVRLQVAIAAGKLSFPGATRCLLELLEGDQDDGLLPRIIWNQLRERLPRDVEEVALRLARATPAPSKLLIEMAPRIAARLLDEAAPEPDPAAEPGLASDQPSALAAVLAIATPLLTDEHAPHGEAVLAMLVGKLQTGEMKADAFATIYESEFVGSLGTSLAAVQLRAFARDQQAITQLVDQLRDRSIPEESQLSLVQTLSVTNPALLDGLIGPWLREATTSDSLPTPSTTAILRVVVQRGTGEARRQILEALPRMPPALQANLASSWCQREATAAELLGAIAAGTLRKEIVPLNDLRSLVDSENGEIRDQVEQIWGRLRKETSAERQAIVEEMTRYFTKEARGNPRRGLAVYDRVCGQCHLLHDRGAAVGPSLTQNGRGSFQQLIVSVFDPGLVIGQAYQSVSVLTRDGRLLTGIPLEESDQRLVLRVQGGKDEAIPRSEIEQLRRNPTSLMPEGLEQQISRQELADLFALLAREGSLEAEDPRSIPGTPTTLIEESAP